MTKSLINAKKKSRAPIIHSERVSSTLFDGLVGLVDILQAVREDLTKDKMNESSYFEDIDGSWIYFKKHPKDGKIEPDGRRRKIRHNKA
ncbi:hypothetical protein IJG21_02600 [Candidatus Saccharibacteria bacterium]|nr:hypothetical protein [Candidatus Saccharibacteria bacterium]